MAWYGLVSCGMVSNGMVSGVWWCPSPAPTPLVLQPFKFCPGLQAMHAATEPGLAFPSGVVVANDVDAQKACQVSRCQ